MSFQNAAVVTAPSSIAPTGGTALAFTPITNDGSKVDMVVAADTDSRTRRHLIGSIVMPKPQATAPNGYTQARGEIKFRKPKLLANGKYTTNEVIVSMRYDPETTQVEIQELMDVGAQLCFDADFVNFWKLQSLA
jgi:hypothetical protein